ncbi:hypothetical protein GGX14DRAFT_648049 [Mycena pura]|uniref:Uncharacterized protein n=1 Tax=Mycena pura TaxID=153505 RepID=A0AAD6V8G1_9AGAR|nr:hypothetical protein GGX14DRAFT_648049 [Mycena pura]
MAATVLERPFRATQAPQKRLLSHMERLSRHRSSLTVFRGVRACRIAKPLLSAVAAAERLYRATSLRDTTITLAESSFVHSPDVSRFGAAQWPRSLPPSMFLTDYLPTHTCSTKNGPAVQRSVGPTRAAAVGAVEFSGGVPASSRTTVSPRSLPDVPKIAGPLSRFRSSQRRRSACIPPGQLFPLAVFTDLWVVSVAPAVWTFLAKHSSHDRRHSSYMLGPFVEITVYAMVTLIKPACALPLMLSWTNGALVGPAMPTLHTNRRPPLLRRLTPGPHAAHAFSAFALAAPELPPLDPLDSPFPAFFPDFDVCVPSSSGCSSAHSRRRRSLGSALFGFGALWVRRGLDEQRRGHSAAVLMHEVLTRARCMTRYASLPSSDRCTSPKGLLKLASASQYWTVALKLMHILRAGAGTSTNASDAMRGSPMSCWCACALGPGQESPQRPPWRAPPGSGAVGRRNRGRRPRWRPGPSDAPRRRPRPCGGISATRLASTWCRAATSRGARASSAARGPGAQQDASAPRWDLARPERWVADVYLTAAKEKRREYSPDSERDDLGDSDESAAAAASDSDDDDKGWIEQQRRKWGSAGRVAGRRYSVADFMLGALERPLAAPQEMAAGGQHALPGWGGRRRPCAHIHCRRPPLAPTSGMSPRG